MDENGTPLAEVSEPVAPPPATTTKARFKGFALYHTVYSLLFCALCALISPLLAACFFSAGAYFLYSVVPLLCILGMGLYFPLGMRKAKRAAGAFPPARSCVCPFFCPASFLFRGR